MPFPYPVAPYIQSHHERWDGTGYPDGLKGEAIPLGARVLAVVDYYDALTAQPPLSPGDGAGQKPSRRSGSRPARRSTPACRAVHRSSRAHRRQRRAGARDAAPDPSVRATDRRPGHRLLHSSAAAPLDAATTVYQSISQATQEVRTLYDIAQTMGTRLSVDDTMGLLTSKLNRLVPASCWALYVARPTPRRTPVPLCGGPVRRRARRASHSRREG